MTVAFSLAWQSFRHGRYASPIGRAGLVTLRATLNPSNRSKQHIHDTLGVAKSSPVLPPLICTTRPVIASYPTLFELCGQARCESLRKSKTEQSPRQKVAQNEVSMSRAEINAIFEHKIGRKDGGDLLTRLQEQRHRGTLDQKLPYPDALITKGLTYLREKYPLNEDAAIIARIDREADDEEYRLPQTNVDKSPHAISQFEKLVRENKEKLEKAEAESKMEKQKTAVQENLKEDRMITVRDRIALVQQRPEPEWVTNYRKKAQMTELPEMSALARLLPSGLFTAAVVVIAVLFAQNYKQPSRKARLWPGLPPAAATIIALVGINVAIFLLWRVPPFWGVLNRNFLVVPAYPHAISMLTACCSHQSLTHLLTNMFALWLIGTRLHDDIGRGPFLALYTSSAVVAAYIPMAVYVMKGFFSTSTLGASGVVTALLGTYCVLHEGQNIALPFLPPEWTRGVDTGVLLAVFLMLEVMSLRKWGIKPANLLNTGRPDVDNMGHLLGYLTGVGAGAFIRSTDSKWKTAERKHFFTKDFGKT